MARNFEVFQGRHRPAHKPGVARVTLTSRDYFVFTRDALELLGNPEAVIYLYDRASRAVAFAPSSRNVAHAYRVNVTPRGGAGHACARAFCRHYEIRLDRPLKRLAAMHEGRLVIELANPPAAHT